MSRSLFSASLVAISLSMAGCVSAPQQTASSSQAEPQPVTNSSCAGTGSNIRRRDCREGVETLSRKEMENRLHDAVPQRPDPLVPTN
jgi:Flp pilus assembly protein TadD